MYIKVPWTAAELAKIHKFQLPVAIRFARVSHYTIRVNAKFTLIVFVEYSFSHVPLPYNKFHVSLKGCSQIIEIGTFING